MPVGSTFSTASSISKLQRSGDDSPIWKPRFVYAMSMESQELPFAQNAVKLWRPWPDSLTLRQPLRRRSHPMARWCYVLFWRRSPRNLLWWTGLPIGLQRVAEVSGSPLGLIGRFNEGRAGYSIGRHCYRALSRPEVRVHPSRYHDICVMLRLESFFDGIRYHASEWDEVRRSAR